VKSITDTLNDHVVDVGFGVGHAQVVLDASALPDQRLKEAGDRVTDGSSRWSKPQCDDPLMTAGNVLFVLRFGTVEMGSPSKMAARRRCAEIASAPCGSRSAE
jgi:hypothetical protein